jgi:hypothetical protein
MALYRYSDAANTMSLFIFSMPAVNLVSSSLLPIAFAACSRTRQHDQARGCVLLRAAACCGC